MSSLEKNPVEESDLSLIKDKISFKKENEEVITTDKRKREEIENGDKDNSPPNNKSEGDKPLILPSSEVKKNSKVSYRGTVKKVLGAVALVITVVWLIFSVVCLCIGGLLVWSGYLK